MTQTAFRQPSNLPDRIAAGWAILCAIHCIALPLFLFSVPSLYLALYSSHHPHRRLAMTLLGLMRYEPWFVAGGALASAIAIRHGWRQHHRVAPGLLAGGGLFLLAVAASAGPALAWAHSAGVVAGGALLVTAHALNARVRRAHICAG